MTVAEASAKTSEINFRIKESPDELSAVIFFKVIDIKTGKLVQRKFVWLIFLYCTDSLKRENMVAV